MPGWTAKDRKVNGAEAFGRFLASNYHQPGDDLSLPMDLGAVEQFTRVNLDIVRAIRARRTTVYVPWFWRWIMAALRVVPQRLFARLDL